MDYFYTAIYRRSHGATWPIFAPALTRALPGGIQAATIWNPACPCGFQKLSVSGDEDVSLRMTRTPDPGSGELKRIGSFEGVAHQKDLCLDRSFSLGCSSRHLGRHCLLEQERSDSSPSPLPASSALRKRRAVLPVPILSRVGKAKFEPQERYDPGSRSPLRSLRTGIAAELVLKLPDVHRSHR